MSPDMGINGLIRLFHPLSLWPRCGRRMLPMVLKPPAKPLASLRSRLSPSLVAPVITSSSTREYTVRDPEHDGAAPSNIHTYQWRQTITFQECAHDDSRPALPRTQQLSVDSVFVLYNQEERILRYALSNSVGPVRGKRWRPGLCTSSALSCATLCSVFYSQEEENDANRAGVSLLDHCSSRHQGSLFGAGRDEECSPASERVEQAIRAAAGLGRAFKTLHSKTLHSKRNVCSGPEGI